MFNTKSVGYSQISLRVDTIAKLKQLRELGIIPSMSKFVEFLITKEIQEFKKRNILKSRENREEKTMKLTNNYDYALELYMNEYDDYMSNHGYEPILDSSETEIMEWVK